MTVVTRSFYTITIVIAALLITLREVIEASLIVATMLGILIKLHQRESVKIVWVAAVTAFITSFLFVFGGSLLGVQIQKLYDGNAEPLIEGTLLVASSFFVTWAVFVLHKHFARKKMHMLEKMKETIAASENRGIFFLTFTAVLREGTEIALFLSAMYVTSNPAAILLGFAGGVIGGLLVSLLFFSASIRLPVYWAFRTTSYLLIVFAAGLLARGIGDLLEFSPVTSFPMLTLGFLPAASSATGGIVESMFGVTRSMNAAAVVGYTLYLFLMHRRVFVTAKSALTSTR